MGNKKNFSKLSERDMQLNIEMGDDGKYQVEGIGTIRFERESGNPLYLRDVLYVPGLRKNLVSVSTLEDKGYGITFSKGRVFIKSSTLSWLRRLGLGTRDCTGYSLRQLQH